MLTLAIDTATKTLSAALLAEGFVLAETFLNVKANHSLVLLPVIEDICRRTGVELEEVDLFACTVGPGSFTGLRIGLSTVKGFALATGKPAAGVSTLEALAFNVLHASMMICPMLDARKEQVYAALFRASRTGALEVVQLEAVQEERLTDPASLLRDTEGDILFLGDGAQRYRALIRETLPERSFFASGHHQLIRAAAVGLLGERKYRNGDLLDLMSFTPRYLRASEAEVKQPKAAD